VPGNEITTVTKMPNCPALKRNGEVCGHRGFYFENHCGTHHNSKMGRDAEYRARYQAHKAAETARQQAREQQVAEAAQARAAEREAAAEAARQQAIRRREERVEKNQIILDSVANISPYVIILYVQRLMHIWKTYNITGYDCVKAYAVLKYKSSNHAGFLNLMRAVMGVYLQSNGNHPDHELYTDVPADERQQALAAVTAALTPYGEIDHMTIISTADKYWAEVQRRIAAEAQAAAQAAEAAAAAARHAQLLADLNERPVVFRRDPEGSIDLAAFGRDPQSVHRSSVQSNTEKSVIALMSRPLAEGQETLSEIIESFSTGRIVRFSSPAVKERAITEITNDYFNIEAFSIAYGGVLDRVWGYIREHVEKTELIIRLAQEVVEGFAQCSNGKMARLVNVLAGYDETLETSVPTRELFMARFALLTKQPMASREAQARALFEEFTIPAEEHNVWLEPLLEA
jgi:hypothetical protein